MSTTVTVKLQLAVLLDPSVAVKVTTVPPMLIIVPGTGDCVSVGLAVQLSAAIAVPV